MTSGRMPTVSYVMPVLNEAETLASAVAAVLNQDYPGSQEVVLAIAPSTDGTEEIARALAADNSGVLLVDNPAMHIPAGLNRAIDAAHGEIIVRVDAHSVLPPGYTRAMVEVLERTGAVNVGGRMSAQGSTPLQRSVARAYNSPLGLGGGAYHSGSEEGPADSAYLGVFQRAALDEVGRYDESLRRGEDYDLNSRLRAAGHTVWFVPTIEVAYWPRDGWLPLARQMYATGVWRGEMVRRTPRTPLRYLAPPALVVGLAASAAIRVTGLDRRAPLPAGLVHLGPAAYAAFLAISSQRLGAATARDRARDAAVLATIHLSWGSGFLKGLVTGAGRTVDRSRVRAP